MAPKTSGKAVKKAGKAQKNITKTDKKKKRERKESYAIYIQKVLEEVHPDMELSCKAMSSVDSLMNYMFERITAESSRLAHCNRRKTIRSQDVENAVKLLFSGDLAKHAVSEGTKSLMKYNSGPILKRNLQNLEEEAQRVMSFFGLSF